MFRKRFFSSGVLIVLLMVCVAFSAELFGCTPDTAAGGVGSAGGLFGGSGNDPAQGAPEADLPPAAVSEWDLPIVVPITGAESGAGLAAAWGFDYGIKTVNEMGGIRGLPVKITIRDVASSDPKVAAEIGMVASTALVALGPSIEPLYQAGEQAFYGVGMPVIGAATDAENREAFQPYAISCIASPDSAAVSAMETWMRTERFSKLCIFYDPASAERTEAAESAATAAGKEIAERFELGNEAFDAASVAEKAYASGADAYYIDLNSQDTIRVVTQLKYLAGDGASKLKILCGPKAAEPVLAEGTAGEMLGVRVWATLDPGKDAEKRKAFDDGFARNVGDPAYYEIAVDYYQAALLIKQAVDSLGLTGSADALEAERAKLAMYLYDTALVSTDHGDFIIEGGAKLTASKLYMITEKGFQS
ncbi:MAG: ABC transporter substrate-binding protein [Clostridiales Family XIII bacterium]|jgi:ABC-type branched-subunit amino acid transport system substrate-binding protein|nr:ABC transporter substrate-binding protein [Clostridiales Family XIII bacterium]